MRHLRLHSAPRLAALFVGLLLATGASGQATKAPDAATSMRLLRCRPGVDMACVQLTGTVGPAASAATPDWSARLGADPLIGPGLMKSSGDERLRVLVLYDVSGSMLKDNAIALTRVPLRTFLKSLPPSTSAAVVPFESQNVTKTIRAARFVSIGDIGGQLDRLPTPRRNGNTALYSSIVLGLDVLDASDAEGGRSVLVVLTDGANDVGHLADGDEPGLLDAKTGGREVARQRIASSSHSVWLVGVGAGVRSDELEALAGDRAGKSVVPLDPVKLAENFQRIREGFLPGRTATYVMPSAVHDRLGRRAETLHAPFLTDADVRWRPPFVAVPPYEGSLVTVGADSVTLSAEGRLLLGVAGSDVVPRLVVGLPLLFVLLGLYVLLPRTLSVPRDAGQAASPAVSASTTHGAQQPLRAAAAVEAPPRLPTDITADAAVR